MRTDGEEARRPSEEKGGTLPRVVLSAAFFF